MDGPGVSTRARVVRVVRLGLGRVGLCSRFHSQALQVLIGPGRCQIDEEPDQDHTSRPLNGLVVFGEAPAPAAPLSGLFLNTEKSRTMHVLFGAMQRVSRPPCANVKFKSLP